MQNSHELIWIYTILFEFMRIYLIENHQRIVFIDRNKAYRDTISKQKSEIAKGPQRAGPKQQREEGRRGPEGRQQGRGSARACPGPPLKPRGVQRGVASMRQAGNSPEGPEFLCTRWFETPLFYVSIISATYLTIKTTPFNIMTSFGLRRYAACGQMFILSIKFYVYKNNFPVWTIINK
jgi:hypothetical protein